MKLLKTRIFKKTWAEKAAKYSRAVGPRKNLMRSLSNFKLILLTLELEFKKKTFQSSS
jgi:hypothetical protein